MKNKAMNVKTVRISDEQWQKMQEIAKKSGLTRSTVVRMALHDFILKHKD